MLVELVPLAVCACGLPGMMFSPGRDALHGPGGILIQRGIATTATCLQCFSGGQPIMADKAPPSGYNGPGKSQFNDCLGEYTEIRFNVMKWTAKAAALKARWETKGGDFENVQHIFKLAQLAPEEQQAKIASRTRAEGWAGIATVTEEDGQISFTAQFDQKPDELGVGGAPIGSRLSLARAATAGYNAGRHGGSLSDCPFAAESEEAHAWETNYGDGMMDRVEKPPRAPQANGKSATDEMAETAAAMPLSESEQNVVAIGRKRRKALPAPDSNEELPPAIA